MSIKGAMDRALKSVITAGGDFSDVYFETASSHSFHYEEGAFEQISSSRSDGVGARVIRGDSTSLVHSPGIDLKDGLFCLYSAATNNDLSPVTGEGDGSRVLTAEESLPTPDFSFFKEVDLKIRGGAPWVKQVSMSLSTSQSRFAVYSSDGAFADDTRKYTLFSVEVVVEKDGILQTGYESEAYSLNSGAFFRRVSPMGVAQKALSRALLMLEAPLCPAGTGAVLLSGEAGGTMVHEACGHGLEADIVQKDFSVYRDKIGKRVASSMVTLVDDGSLPGLLGSGKFDDEGTPCRKNVLIEGGVLRGYLTDKLSARDGGLALSGNGRRSSYRSVPQPRMTNTYIEPGDTSPDEILKKMKEGLFVKKMGGGEVDPTTGDFVFHVTEGYLVKDGRLLHPVRGAVLTGNGPEVLMDIEAVGNDLHFLPGMCGKSGQSVPVSDGQPSMLVRKMVVGGAGA